MARPTDDVVLFRDAIHQAPAMRQSLNRTALVLIVRLIWLIFGQDFVFLETIADSKELS
ncbi:hypothetical protein EDC27_0450 [Desulfosoma caldarium]|uniref:Uncharacterized protein n=1 Tax=Desulfosoma caldarium TaxID=610254 RepID=A0A3N1VMA4_9BACT|nr:hypothetical protein EDC27_0450 [Desulfosoma caldarium]